jgi:hypothetical protein
MDSNDEQHNYNTNPEGRRKIQRPKPKWEDGVDNDIKPLDERNCKNLARKRSIQQNLPQNVICSKRSVFQ